MRHKNLSKFSDWSKVLCTIFFSCLVFALSAQFAGGEGTEEDPWQIAQPGDLNRIRDYLGAEHNDKYFIQTEDIDLDVQPFNQAEGWVTIGTSDASFQGNFDGNGYNIHNLMIDNQSSHQGLFGTVDSATLRNINLVGVDIRCIAWGNIGALAGRTHEGTLVENCSATGTVIGDTAAQRGWMSGGLIGNAVNTTIVNCYADVDVTGWTRCGGLVGWVNAGDVRNSYATGNVNNTGAVAGGLVGLLMTWGDGVGDGTVYNSYATGAVNVGSNQGGGLIGTIGNADVSYCFATGEVTGTGGGLVGRSSAQNTVSNSYWDVETTGKEESEGGGEGKLTRQMIYPYDFNEAYLEWDFDEIWREDVEFEDEDNPGMNNGYPYLYYQIGDAEPLDTPVVSIQLIEENQEYSVRISWQAVEEAQSYRVYAFDCLEAEDWDEPAAITDQTHFTEIVADRSKFYSVVASSQEAP